MSFKIGHYYKDPHGTGVFFMNIDKTVSWGSGPNNVIKETKEEALVFAASLNRPGTDDNWMPFPIRGIDGRS